MDLNGGNVTQVTSAGKVDDAEWSVDGRIFTHWEQPEGICFNCLVTVDGTDIADAGGKGTIQEFLPFWTNDGHRVELGSGDVNGSGNDDIFLVGENFPDLFYFLTNSPGNDRNPDTAATCGPTHGIYPQYGSIEAAKTTETNEAPADNQLSNGAFVIGYTGDIGSIMQKDFDQACSKLEVECLKGESITELADKGVDAIIDASNRWDVMGSHSAIHDTVERGIPLFILNAETDDQGVYNLSAEHEIYMTTLHWMFQQMEGQGKFLYYNFGDSTYIQYQIDSVLTEYPGVTAIKKPADYSGNSFTQQQIAAMVAEDPNLSAIWATEQLNDIFWSINDNSNNHHPLTECMARKDEFINWKNVLDSGSDFQCIAQVRPGGTAYEGIYVAYYYLSGLKFKPDAFFAGSNNTLRYDIPVITNAELPTWIGEKLEPLRVSDNGFLELPPMTPNEIKARWFEE